MHISCLLVITKESLLNLALTNLISASDQGLVVVNSTAETFDELTVEINTFNTDVILMEKSSSFAADGSLTKLLMMYPKISLIIVNEENNWLHVYCREDKLITSSSDLMNVIVASKNY